MPPSHAEADDHDDAGMQLRDGSPSKKRGSESHSLPVIILTVVMVILYIVSLLFPNSQRWGWLPTSVGNASDDHPTLMTPAGYAFTIWIIIFMWQMLWLVYALVNLCRRNDRGPVYRNPPVIATVHFSMSYITALVAICAWYFAWTNAVMWASLIIIAVIPVTVWTCIALLTRALVKHEHDFSSRVDLWIYRILVLNGLSIFATWTSIATHINIAIVIIYDIDAPVATGSIIALAVLLLLVVVYVFLDLFYWDRYLRYNMLSFPVVIWASAAVIVERKREDPEGGVDDIDASFVLAALILAVGCVAFLLKIALLALRSVREATSDSV